MDYICQDFASNIRILSPNAADAIKLQLSKLSIPNLDEEDKAAEKANQKLIQHTAIIAGFWLFVGASSASYFQ